TVAGRAAARPRQRHGRRLRLVPRTGRGLHGGRGRGGRLAAASVVRRPRLGPGPHPPKGLPMSLTAAPPTRRLLTVARAARLPTPGAAELAELASLAGLTGRGGGGFP